MSDDNNFHGKINLDVLTYCGYRDGAETSADGSADNDLACERADAAHDFLRLVRNHSLPSVLMKRLTEPVLQEGDAITVLVSGVPLPGVVMHGGNLGGGLVAMVELPR